MKLILLILLGSRLKLILFQERMRSLFFFSTKVGPIHGCLP